MVFNEQVLIALEVLRNFAENEFELHRIDVLEKDLSAPPQVEQVDETHQKFNGVIYRKSKDSHYRMQYDLQRVVYYYYCGDIPEGYVIHHVNFNPEDNDISNLALLTRAEHGKIHNFSTRKFKAICAICGAEFESYNKSKYCSQNCREIAESKEKTCPACGKKFLSNDRSTVYCSPHCAQSKRRERQRESRPNKIFTCQNCGKKYYGSESPLDKYCSTSCQNAYYYRNKREKRNCVICNREFSTHKYHNVKTCCKECAEKLGWQNRRKKSSQQ